MAVILCIVGLVTIKKHPEYSGKKYGVTGLVIGLLAILETALFVIIFLNVPRD